MAKTQKKLLTTAMVSNSSKQMDKAKDAAKELKEAQDKAKSEDDEK